jgi:hypothetical protein
VQDRFWTLHLITYMHFWPDGFGEDAVRPLRVLASGPGGELLYEADVEEHERKRRQIRDYINVVMRDSLHEALSPSFEPLQRALNHMEGIFETGSLLGEARAQLRDRYGETAIQHVRERIRTWFGEMVFGRDVDLAAIEARRLEVLTEELTHDDVAVLRRALLNGLVFRPAATREHEMPSKSTLDAIDRIRAVAQEKLGVPLVRWSERELAIVLDLARA